jgi:alkanesulfonate monooxygenase SsuD/methylene tetrahydromethanopterin reductase-like flavin-dependent oxidoreductase (luciferase family)
MVNGGTVELGLFVEPQMGGSHRRLVELAQWAEARGIEAFARSDHYLNMDESAPTTDALTSLAAVAAETSEIRLITLVSPITFRHPAVMAKSATTIDEISGGRFTLGVGTGWMETEHDAFGLDLPPMGERFDRLEEALAYIRTVFAGGGVTDGNHYALDQDPISPPGSDGLEIVVGGGGPRKTPRLAGTYADEYNMFVTDAETLASRVSVMRDAALAVGRDPDGILVSFAGPAMVFADEDEYLEVASGRAHKRDMPLDDYRAMLTSRFVPHGTPDEAADAISRMADAGIGRYYVQEYAHLDDLDLDALGVVFDALRTS